MNYVSNNLWHGFAEQFHSVFKLPLNSVTQYLQFVIFYCVQNVPNIKKFPSLLCTEAQWSSHRLFILFLLFYNCGWFPFHFLLSNLWWELESPFIYRYSTLTCIIHPLLKNGHYPSSHFLILPLLFGLSSFSSFWTPYFSDARG